MNTGISISAALILPGLAQALLLAVASFQSGPGTRLSRQLFAAFVACLAVGMANGFYVESGLYALFSQLLGFPMSFQFLAAPLLWLYVCSLTEADFRLRGLHLLHLLPFLICLILELPIAFESGLWRMILFHSWLNDFRPNSDYFARFWFEATVPLQAGCYLVLVTRRIRRHERLIREFYSNIDNLTIAWLRQVVVAFALGMVGLAAGWVLLFAGIRMNGFFLAAPLAWSALVWYLSWLALTRNQTILGAEPALPITADVPAQSDTGSAIAKPLTADSSGPTKYEKNLLPAEYCRRIERDLAQLMERQKPYLECGLTLVSLASKLRVSRNHLSQVLNQHLETSFYDYVTFFRLKEVSSRLTDPDAQGQSIIDIASDCGFNTKSTFNKAFKEWYGVSPSEYRAGLRCPSHAGVPGDKGIPRTGQLKPMPPAPGARS